MAASLPALSQLGMDASSTTSTEAYEVELVSLRMAEDLYEHAGLRGTREHFAARVAQNTRAPSFTVRLTPNSVELDALLPRIMGAAESTDVFDFAETLPTFVTVMDLGGTKRLQFTGCKVDVAEFEGMQGGPLSLTLSVEALDVAVSNDAFASLTISTVGPYMYSAHTASGLVVNSQTLQFMRSKVTINNMLIKDRFLNSQTRVSLPESDRITTWEWDGPYGDNNALYGLSAAGVASTATYTLANRSILFSSPAVAYPRELPQFSARQPEIMLPLVGVARKSGSTPSLRITNDSTP
jgi:hypothetical protein